MTRCMKLQPEYFEYILNGTKRIELRLNDEKRNLINLGNIIEFKKEPNLNETLNVRVTDLLYYPTFKDLFEHYDISVLADKNMTKQDLLSVLETFYTKDKQLLYGVVGIKFEII